MWVLKILEYNTGFRVVNQAFHSDTFLYFRNTQIQKVDQCRFGEATWTRCLVIFGKLHDLIFASLTGAPLTPSQFISSEILGNQ